MSVDIDNSLVPSSPLEGERVHASIATREPWGVTFAAHPPTGALKWRADSPSRGELKR